MSSTLGIIIGNRDFFPDHLITEARNEVLNIFKNKGLKPIISVSYTHLRAHETN